MAQFQGKMDAFQGNMNTILDYLQAEKATTSTSVANPASAVITNVIAVTTSVDVVVDTVVQSVSQPIFHLGPSRHAIAYPRGLPPNFTPQAANGNAFVPYQPFVIHPANGNPVSYPWRMTILSPQMVNVNNREILPEQALQTSALVVVETPNDNEDEYRGPTLHLCLPPRATQPTIHNLNQGVQIPPPHPGASSVVAPSFVYPRAPYAPYQN